MYHEWPPCGLSTRFQAHESDSQMERIFLRTGTPAPMPWPTSVVRRRRDSPAVPTHWPPRTVFHRLAPLEQPRSQIFGSPESSSWAQYGCQSLTTRKQFLGTPEARTLGLSRHSHTFQAIRRGLWCPPESWCPGELQTARPTRNPNCRQTRSSGLPLVDPFAHESQSREEAAPGEPH